VTARVTR